MYGGMCSGMCSGMCTRVVGIDTGRSSGQLVRYRSNCITGASASGGIGGGCIAMV